MRSGTELLEFGKARFLAELEALIDVYAAAMHPPPLQLPGRKEIMERHASFPSFRCVAMTLTGDLPRAEHHAEPHHAEPHHAEPHHAEPHHAEPHHAEPHHAEPHHAEQYRSGNLLGGRRRPPRPQPRIVGFAYGFHGADGQWWHDLVRAALTVRGGLGRAREWLDDSFEVAEVHVHPGYQGRGIGRAMVPRLALPRLERTAVLSTQDSESRARRLYRSLGFTDLLTSYRFHGADPPYAVMGAVLPLRRPPGPGARPPA